jgi:hypothetical protein
MSVKAHKPAKKLESFLFSFIVPPQVVEANALFFFGSW